MRIEDKWENLNLLQDKKNANRDPIEDFKNFVLGVDAEIKKSQRMKKDFLNGKDIPVYQIFIQSQKAKVSLELLTKIRDEALKAYQTVINMRI
jgi:flagellar hook-basal body complex protein FliE